MSQAASSITNWMRGQNGTNSSSFAQTTAAKQTRHQMAKEAGLRKGKKEAKKPCQEKPKLLASTISMVIIPHKK